MALDNQGKMENLGGEGERGRREQRGEGTKDTSFFSRFGAIVGPCEASLNRSVPRETFTRPALVDADHLGEFAQLVAQAAELLPQCEEPHYRDACKQLADALYSLRDWSYNLLRLVPVQEHLYVVRGARSRYDSDSGGAAPATLPTPHRGVNHGVPEKLPEVYPRLQPPESTRRLVSLEELQQETNRLFDNGAYEGHLEG